jgi:hypothetical protein
MMKCKESMVEYQQLLLRKVGENSSVCKFFTAKANFPHVLSVIFTSFILKQILGLYITGKHKMNLNDSINPKRPNDQFM